MPSAAADGAIVNPAEAAELAWQRLQPKRWPLPPEAFPGEAALVGGAVRDALLDRLGTTPDLDLVVEGSGAALVEQLAQALAQRGFDGAITSSQVHGAYGTVELELVVAGQSLLLDVATARRESYGVPAENPQVRFGALADDLARRDFTINAMALVLAGAGSLSPVLLDPHGGQADLERRQLRLLLQHQQVQEQLLRCQHLARAFQKEQLHVG